jgi:hypothetical protein
MYPSNCAYGQSYSNEEHSDHQSFYFATHTVVILIKSCTDMRCEGMRVRLKQLLWFCVCVYIYIYREREREVM